MSFEEVLSKIPYGNCLLFTGAGFSMGAENVKGKLQLAWRYAEELYEIAGVDAKYRDGDLSIAAQWYQKEVGSDKLIEFLQQTFTIQNITDSQKEIAKQNWRRCYTINYDEIIEMAYLANGKSLTPVCPSYPIRDYNNKSVCIHLNGHIGNLNRNTLNNEFKLTSLSYAYDTLPSSSWWSLFDSDRISCDAIIFIGCSLKYDLDIRRLLNGTKALKEKTFFIVAKDENPTNLMLLEQLGTPITIGTDGFAHELSKIAPVKLDSFPKTYKFFSQPNIRKTSPTKKFTDLQDLLVTGELNEHLLDYSLREPDLYPYFIHRDKISHILKKIKEGRTNFAITSDLGNGKTIFIRALCYLLARQNYNVFYLEKNLPGAADELRYICEHLKDNTVIIIESYNANIDLVHELSLHRDGQVVILAERKTNYDVTNHLICELEEEDPFYEVNLNILSHDEIYFLITIFEKNHLWVKALKWSYDQKFAFITKQCKSNLSQVILNITKSDDLDQRYKKVIAAIKNKDADYMALLYILISKLFDFDLSLSELIDDLNYDALNYSNLEKNLNLRELIDFEREEISFKSSIFAQHIVQDLLDSDYILEPLITLFSILHEKRATKRVRRQLTKMTKYSNLKKLFKSKTSSAKGLNKAIFTFYENIADCDHCKEEPLFWLQFAIARLFDRDYFNAKECFARSYHYAGLNPYFDTFQIDNHFARYRLESAVYYETPEDIMGNFRKAHASLMYFRPGDNYRWYSYRVAINYLDYYKKFYSSFDSAEQKEFIRCCIDMRERVKEYLRLENAAEKELIGKTLDGLNQILGN